MKLAAILFFLPLLALACPEKFSGRYDGFSDSQFLSKYDSIEIENGDNSQLTITYNYKNEWNRKFTEAYVADGKEHAGDIRYTGDKYSVVCSEEKIWIRREFRQLNQPLIYEFTFVNDELQLVESFEGTEYTRLAARFIKTGP